MAKAIEPASRKGAPKGTRTGTTLELMRKGPGDGGTTDDGSMFRILAVHVGRLAADLRLHLPAEEGFTLIEVEGSDDSDLKAYAGVEALLLRVDEGPLTTQRIASVVGIGDVCRVVVVSDEAPALIRTLERTKEFDMVVPEPFDPLLLALQIRSLGGR